MTARAQPPATASWVPIGDSMRTAHTTRAFTPGLPLLSLHREA